MNHPDRLWLSRFGRFRLLVEPFLAAHASPEGFNPSCQLQLRTLAVRNHHLNIHYGKIGGTRWGSGCIDGPSLVAPPQFCTPSLNRPLLSKKQSPVPVPHEYRDPRKGAGMPVSSALPSPQNQPQVNLNAWYGTKEDLEVEQRQGRGAAARTPPHHDGRRVLRLGTGS